MQGYENRKAGRREYESGIELKNLFSELEKGEVSARRKCGKS